LLEDLRPLVLHRGTNLDFHENPFPSNLQMDGAVTSAWVGPTVNGGLRWALRVPEELSNPGRDAVLVGAAAVDDHT
jgi:hypothetical protein